MTTAVIVDAVRTASGRGKPGGALSGVHPVDLLALTCWPPSSSATASTRRTVDDVIAGCVSQVGEQALNIGRASRCCAAGFPSQRAGDHHRPPVRLQPAGRPLRGPGGHRPAPTTS